MFQRPRQSLLKRGVERGDSFEGNVVIVLFCISQKKSDAGNIWKQACIFAKSCFAQALP